VGADNTGTQNFERTVMAHGTFRSVANASDIPQPGNTSVGDLWWVTTTGLLYFIVGDGTAVQLLTSTPVPTLGPQGLPGVQGQQGEAGPAFPAQMQYSGSWLASPQEYAKATVVSYNGFLYVSLSYLNVSDNTMAPAGNPFWSIIGPVNTTRTSAVVCFIDGAGVPLAAPATHGVFSFPFNGTITGWSLVSDVPGSAVLDILWASYANFPGGLASIVGGNNPSLTAQQKNENLNVSALWSPVNFQQGDQLQFILDSSSGVTQLTLTLILSATN
jgi:hypothetical protein